MPEASREAHDNLREAILRVLQEREAIEPGEVLTDFAIMCETVGVDVERNAYISVYPDGMLATHRVVGLHRIGIDRALAEGWEERE